MSDAPRAVTTFEPVDVSTAESLVEDTVIVTAAMPCEHVRLHVRQEAIEVDDRVSEEVHRCLAVVAKARGRVVGEVDAEAVEHAVVVGCVGVVHRGDEFGVATIDAPAVVEKSTADLPLVEKALGRKDCNTHACSQRVMPITIARPDHVRPVAATSGTLDRMDLHLADSAFWTLTQQERLDEFARLRAEEPVRHYPARQSGFSRRCTAFWALTKHEDAWNVSRNADLFCSSVSIDIEETPPELSESVNSMINFDDPKHARMRRLVSSGFTPKRTAQLDKDLRRSATNIINDVLERFGDGTEFDFVQHVASRLPLAAISDMVGIPAEEQAQILQWTNTAMAIEDPGVGVQGAVAATDAMTEYALALGRSKRQRPTDDLVSVLMQDAVDGERLTPQEFANFFGLLVGAGNETTRNAISHGMRLLTEHPDQRRTWFESFDTYAHNAADEIVRFETPITHMARVLKRDTVLRGVPINAGEKVVIWYNSANRDADVFDHADTFDVTRPLVPQHVGFGGGGPHFCLGANLARRQIVVMFDEIRRRAPDLVVTGTPTSVLHMSLHNIKAMPARVR